MKMHKPLLSSILICLLGAPLVSQAADADWKRGRVYYRMVCTACHVEKASAIAPSTKTMAEWNAYLLADKHAKGKDSVKFYLSKKYRDSVKATNKAAEKYADVPEQELFEDLKAFVIKGAKDGESPASCS